MPNAGPRDDNMFFTTLSKATNLSLKLKRKNTFIKSLNSLKNKNSIE